MAAESQRAAEVLLSQGRRAMQLELSAVTPQMRLVLKPAAAVAVELAELFAQRQRKRGNAPEITDAPQGSS